MDCGGPEIDEGPRSSNFAAAYQVIARLYVLRLATPTALSRLNELVAANAGDQDVIKKLKAQRAAVWASWVARTELVFTPRGMAEMQSKLVKQIMQDAISGEVITAEESPESIIKKIAGIIDKHAPDRTVWQDLSAKEKVVKNEELGTVTRRPMRTEPEDRDGGVIPPINCQHEMLTCMNERKEGGTDTKLPLMFGEYPVIKVENGALGPYIAGPSPASAITTSMLGLFRDGKILQQFEWNVDRWRKRGNTDCPKAGEIVYRLASAIIHTNWDGADEYLSVHWPNNSNNPFVRGRQWIKKFDAALEAGKRPNLGEVCALFYE
jgi:hypothetical protein